MVRRRALIALSWALVTASAVGIASLAVSHAVANVADPLPAVLSGAGTAAGPTSTSTTGTVLDAGAPSTSAPAVPADGAVASAGASSATGTPTSSGFGDPGAVQRSDEGAAPSGPSATTRSFSTTGGVVTMSCDGPTATLVSATPAQDYKVVVSNAGPELIEVAFTSPSHDSEFHGQCVNGQPTEPVSDD